MYSSDDDVNSCDGRKDAPIRGKVARFDGIMSGVDLAVAASVGNEYRKPDDIKIHDISRWARNPHVIHDAEAFEIR
ncbi:MAG TPA: hypothetical protein VEH04_10970 [Verrucomicrobiae bacterium]|nr:hypothetical protein [Verrucomicrobiae bacterium]